MALCKPVMVWVESFSAVAADVRRPDITTTDTLGNSISHPDLYSLYGAHPIYGSTICRDTQNFVNCNCWNILQNSGQIQTQTKSESSVQKLSNWTDSSLHVIIQSLHSKTLWPPKWVNGVLVISSGYCRGRVWREIRRLVHCISCCICIGGCTILWRSFSTHDSTNGEEDSCKEQLHFAMVGVTIRLFVWALSSGISKKTGTHCPRERRCSRI